MFNNLNELIDFSKYCFNYISDNTNDIFSNHYEIEEFKQFILYLLK